MQALPQRTLLQPSCLISSSSSMEQDPSLCSISESLKSAGLKGHAPLICHLMQRVTDLEKVIHSMQMERSCPGSPVSSAKKCPYSALAKHPEVPYEFQMPLHYPKYSKSEYEVMPEWQIDRLLEEYGLPVTGSLSDKRKYAIGAFLWRDQM